MTDQVNSPSHYGGKDNPYEVIKIIEALGLGFHLGNTLKYVCRAGKKNEATLIEDLKKAQWYLARYLYLMESKQGKEIVFTQPNSQKPKKHKKKGKKKKKA